MLSASIGRAVPGIEVGTPVVPVLVAAMGPQALRATGELADGVTDVVFSQTDLTTPEDQQRTWRLLGELNRAR